MPTLPDRLVRSVGKTSCHSFVVTPGVQVPTDTVDLHLASCLPPAGLGIKWEDRRSPRGGSIQSGPIDVRDSHVATASSLMPLGAFFPYMGAITILMPIRHR